MRLIDDVGIPDPIMRALERDPYNKGNSDISVTGLLKPPIMRALESHYDEQVVEQASDRIYALLGKAVHAILEMADLSDETKYIAERRLCMDYDGWKISGQIDLIEPQSKVMHDFKVCSRWVGVFGAKEEWTQQQNLYRLLAKHNGIDIDTLKIHAIYRDWSKRDAKMKSDYPPKQIETFVLETWPLDKTARFLQERVHAHRMADERMSTALSMDDLLPYVCTPEERWERERGFAILNGSKTRAIRVLPSRKEAEEWLGSHRRPGETLHIDERLGTPTRCMDYCNVKKWCPFGKRLPSE